MESIDKLREYFKKMEPRYTAEQPEYLMMYVCADIVFPMLDLIEHEYERELADHYILLPIDADGEPIHVGDVMETENGIREVDALQKSSRKWSIGLVPVGGGAFSWRDAETLLHHHVQTVEDVLTEFVATLMERGELSNGGAQTIAEYAAKLRLAGDGE